MAGQGKRSQGHQSREVGQAAGWGGVCVLALSCKPLSKQAPFLHPLPRVRAGWKHW